MSFQKQLDRLFSNSTFTTVASLTLAMYAGLAAPALPDSVVLFFDTIIGKILFMFLIGYVASKNVTVSLMIAVAFVLTLQIANRRALEKFSLFRERFQVEKFDDLADAKTVLCTWVATLSETTTPKKSEIMGKDVGAVLKDYASDLTKEHISLTVDKIKEVADSDAMKKKTVKDVCVPTEEKKEEKPAVPAVSEEKKAEHFFGGDLEVVPADNLSGSSSKMYAPF